MLDLAELVGRNQAGFDGGAHDAFDAGAQRTPQPGGVLAPLTKHDHVGLPFILQYDLRETACVVSGFAGDTAVATAFLDSGKDRRGFFALDFLELRQQGGIRLGTDGA